MSLLSTLSYLTSQRPKTQNPAETGPYVDIHLVWTNRVSTHTYTV